MSIACHRVSVFYMESRRAVLLKAITFVAPLGLLAASPAYAADDALIAGAAAYQKAQTSKSRPSDQSDFAYCAG